MCWDSPGQCFGSFAVFDICELLPLQITADILLQYPDDTALVCSGTSPQDAADVMNQYNYS